jgi:tRNA1Val (adenine37-N6)-methyltransferase
MKVTTDGCLFGAWVAEEVKSQKSKVKNILDVGAGTGLLSLMLAQKNPQAVIDAIEIDKGAAEQGKENVNASPWKDRIRVIHADIKIFSPDEKYDLIISNPPFYEREIKSGVEKKNLAHHSGGLALDELISAVKRNLKPEGLFFLMLPYKRNAEVRRLFKDSRLHIVKLILVRQSVNHDYFRMMIQGKINGHPGEETELDEISIWNAKQEYTVEFADLLKDYYFYL